MSAEQPEIAGREAKKCRLGDAEESRGDLSRAQLDLLASVPPSATVSWAPKAPADFAWNAVVSVIRPRATISAPGVPAVPPSPDSDSDSGGAARSAVFEPAESGVPRKDLLLAGTQRLPLMRMATDEFDADTDADFVLRDMIGRGGQGEVWRAWQASLAREVAVKRVRLGAPDIVEFLQEAYTTATLDHPNIIPVYDLGRVADDGMDRPLLAMKLIRGTPWNKLLEWERKAHGYVYETFLARHLAILIAVGNAIAFAHSREIIHRDLKPHQVMIGDFGEVCLMDWGLAVSLRDKVPTVVRDGIPRHHTLRTASNRCGTPAYMAPEQTLESTEALGYHTDIYLLGAILFELVAGQAPHNCATGHAAYMMALANETHQIPPQCPAELRAIVERTLSTDPRQRPATAREFVKLLEEYVTGAGRRRESVALTREVEGRLKGVAHDYDALSADTVLITRASGLWPQNPDLDRLHENLLEAYAREALRRGDLLLAHVQAERLRDERLRRSLLAEVDGKHREALQTAHRPALFNWRRIAAMAVVYLVVGACVGGVMWAADRTMLRDAREKVRTIATLIARQVDPNDLKVVIETGSMDTPEFRRVLALLQQSQATNDRIKYVYTMRRNPAPEKTKDDWLFIVDALPVDTDLNANGVIEDDEVGSPPGLEYPDGTDAMTVGLFEPYAEPVPHTDDWGTFLSGYAPVVDPETGRPIGIAGIDITVEELAAQFRTIKLVGIASLVALLILVTLTMTTLFQKQRAIEVVRTLDATIKKQYGELRGRNLSLG